MADRWGNVVEYTLTIEQTGGNAMVVPGRGFLLNNEMTDFNFTPTQGTAPDPNLPGPSKRPRSSMSPTIVLENGKPFLAVGSPGGATIITTVLQILINRIDLGMTLPEASRRRGRRTATPTGSEAEPAFRDTVRGRPERAGSHPGRRRPRAGDRRGHRDRVPAGAALIAAAEPVRRGGGAAAVVHPTR